MPAAQLHRSRFAARKLVEIAAGIEPTMPGRIYIELVNDPTLFKLKATAAGVDLPIERGWLDLHESGSYALLLNSGERYKFCDRPGAYGLSHGEGNQTVAQAS
nr:hypothetical protein [Bradyrhizobium diazoefficiens]